MGRYYNGDITGKFWFGLQSSTAADRFGVEHNEPNYVEYYYSQEDLEGVRREIKKIKQNLGDKFQKIDDFFKTNTGYNQESLNEQEITNADLSEYADLMLGIQIRDCIIENGECNFTAEL
jgi:hypothetical protein